MTNRYAFHCPVKGEGVGIEHCEAVHSKSMQGKPHEIEDKVCALAHQCWQCPFRNAVRVGGPWSHYDKKPYASTDPASPAKLPQDLVHYSLSHTPPRDSDYRRCGMWGDDVGMFKSVFDKLCASISGTVSKSTRPSGGPPLQRKGSNKRPASNRTEKKIETAADVIGQGGQDMAAAISDLAKQERSAELQEQTSTPDKQTERKAPQRSAKPASDAPKKLSLAERAKLMKKRSAA